MFDPDPQRPLEMLKACPAYEASPLITMKSAGGVDVLVKDETRRMGLGAFKALGGVYAVAQLIAEGWEKNGGGALGAEELTSERVKAFADTLTFVCASAGNHGMAVAAGARIFGSHSRIHLAETVPLSFEQRLRDKQADVVRSGNVYDESITAANEDAERTGAILLADGSWPGYIHRPSLVMEGYTVIAEEMRVEFERKGEWPTHVFLQAGVGGLAAAIAHMIRKNWSVQPEIIIVEPDAAPCLQASSEAEKPVRADGPVSNMGRLDCKEPSLIAHEALALCDVTFATVSDEAAQAATAYLTGNGMPTTPSGAAGLAALDTWGSHRASGAEFRPLVLVTECAD